MPVGNAGSERRRAGEAGHQAAGGGGIRGSGEGEVEVGAGVGEADIDQEPAAVVAGAEVQAVEEAEEAPGARPDLARAGAGAGEGDGEALVGVRAGPASVLASPETSIGTWTPPSDTVAAPRWARAAKVSEVWPSGGKSASPTAAARPKKAALSGAKPERRASGFQLQGSVMVSMRGATKAPRCPQRAAR